MPPVNGKLALARHQRPGARHPLLSRVGPAGGSQAGAALGPACGRGLLPGRQLCSSVSSPPGSGQGPLRQGRACGGSKVGRVRAAPSHPCLVPQGAGLGAESPLPGGGPVHTCGTSFPLSAEHAPHLPEPGVRTGVGRLQAVCPVINRKRLQTEPSPLTAWLQPPTLPGERAARRARPRLPPPTATGSNAWTAPWEAALHALAEAASTEHLLRARQC